MPPEISRGSRPLRCLRSRRRGASRSQRNRCLTKPRRVSGASVKHHAFSANRTFQPALRSRSVRSRSSPGPTSRPPTSVSARRRNAASAPDAQLTWPNMSSNRFPTEMLSRYSETLRGAQHTGTGVADADVARYRTHRGIGERRDQMQDRIAVEGTVAIRNDDEFHRAPGKCQGCRHWTWRT